MKKFTSFLAALSVAATMSVQADDYVLVTDVADVTTGRYVITAEEGWDMAMSSENTSNYFVNSAVTIDNGVITNPSNSILWDVEVTNGVLTLQSVDTEMYAGLTSAGNKAYTYAALDGNYTNWAVTVDSVTVLTNAQYTDRYMQYNTSSPRFACYTGSQKDLRLFKKAAATAASISVASEIEIGSVATGTTASVNLPISGELLTSDVTVSLAGDDAFAAETTTYSADEVMAGVNFAITFTAPETAGDYTATVTIASSECETIEVAVSATAAGAVTIADIFSMDDNETAIIATATVDYVYSYGSYISDESGKSILAYYLTDVEIGDVLSNISATVATYNSVKQIKSVSYESSVAGESTIEPIEITLAELMGTDGIASYGGQLVTVKGVTLAATGFTSNKITLTQGETTSTLYNGFYITNDEFPTYADVTGYVTVYSSAAQINPRWQDDVVAADGETTDPEPDTDEEPDTTEYVTIAEIYAMDDAATGTIATATVDYVYTYGSYISDENGKSVLAYYLTSVEVGDVLTNIDFTVGSYNGIKQIKSVSYESSVAGESTIEPIELTLAELMGADLNTYGAQLVTVKGVTLASTAFSSNKITITQDGTSSLLYNGFYLTIENDLPTWADVTGYVSAYSSAAQINPRAESDIVASEEEQGETDDEEQDDTVEYVTIADIFAMDDAATGVVATTTVDFVYSSGSYLSDENGTSILALYLTDVEVGDVLTDVSFTAGSYYGLKQMTSVSYKSLAAGTSTIEPIVITIAELMATDGLDLYAHQLVTVESVTFASTTFATSNTITQDGTSTLLYNKFGVTVDGDLPSPADVTGYVNAYNSVAQIFLRSADDIVATGSSAIVMTEASTTAVAGTTGAIVVKAAAATTATIYNTIGQVVAIVEVAAGESAVTLAQGLYLVSVDGAVTKAVVR